MSDLQHSDAVEDDSDQVLWDEEDAKPARPGMTEDRLAMLARGREVRKKHLENIAALRAAGEITRFQKYKRGQLKIEDMDDEEVSRARFRDLAGGWSGSGQRFSGPDILTLRRELLKRGQRLLEENYQAALKALVTIATSPAPTTKEADQLKAVQMIMERVAGKVPDKVEVGGADAFSDLLQDVIDEGVLSIAAEPGSETVMGEIVEDQR